MRIELKADAEEIIQSRINEIGTMYPLFGVSHLIECSTTRDKRSTEATPDKKKRIRPESKGQGLHQPAFLRTTTDTVDCFY